MVEHVNAKPSPTPFHSQATLYRKKTVTRSSHLIIINRNFLKMIKIIITTTTTFVENLTQNFDITSNKT